MARYGAPTVPALNRDTNVLDGSSRAPRECRRREPWTRSLATLRSTRACAIGSAPQCVGRSTPSAGPESQPSLEAAKGQEPRALRIGSGAAEAFTERHRDVLW